MSGPYFLPFCCGEFLKIQPLFYYFLWVCMSTYSQNKWLEMILNFRSQSQKMWATITHDHDCQRPLPNEPQSLTFMIWLAMIADHIHSSVSLVVCFQWRWLGPNRFCFEIWKKLSQSFRASSYQRSLGLRYHKYSIVFVYSWRNWPCSLLPFILQGDHKESLHSPT